MVVDVRFKLCPRFIYLIRGAVCFCYNQAWTKLLLNIPSLWYRKQIKEINWKILIIRRDITLTIFTQESLVPNLDSIPLIDTCMRQFYNKKSHLENYENERSKNLRHDNLSSTKILIFLIHNLYTTHCIYLILFVDIAMLNDIILTMCLNRV